MKLRKTLSKYGNWLRRHFCLIVLLTIGLWGGSRLVCHYLTENQTSLIAIEARTGRVAWSTPLSDSMVEPSRFTMASAGRVFVAQASDFDRNSESYKRYQMEAFDGTSGRRLWTYSPQLSKPDLAEIVAGNLPFYVRGETLWLYLPSERLTGFANIRHGQLVALNTANGQPKWQLDRDWSIEYPRHIGVASSGDRSVVLQIAFNQEIWLEAYHTATGKQLWRMQAEALSKKETPQANLYRRYRLTTSRETLLLSDSGNKTIYGYDWETGKLKFQIKEEKHWEKIAIGDTALYTFGNDSLKAYNANTGIPLWKVEFSNNPTCPYAEDIQAVEGGVYLTCPGFGEPFQTRILFLDAKTGNEGWSDLIPYTSLVGEFPTNSKLGFAFGRPFGESGLVAFARGSKGELWHWQPEFSVGVYSLSTDGDRVFILGEVPRWRNLKWMFGINS